VPWRQFFGDARLQRLIELALQHNHDLRIASLTVEQVRARYRVAELALIPELNANGTASRTQVSGDDLSAAQGRRRSNYTVSLDVPSYELDFFGRAQSLRDEALESFLATQEARRAAHLAVVAQVATQYLAQRTVAEELRLAEETLRAVQDSLRIAQKRHEVGTASRLDLATVEGQVQSANIDVAALRQQLAQADNALALLIGQPLPTDLPAPASLESQGLVADLSPELPSSLLQRRPDILQAEHVLRAANADIGAARAAFFPTISLTAGIGTASRELSRLFEPGTGTWNFVPRVTLPIFEAGRNRATLEVAKLQKQIEIARYEHAIQSAFREVADALAVRAQIDAQIAAYDALARAQQQRFTLSELRYRQGVESYLAVLTAQRDLYAAQQGQIRTRYARNANLIALYHALGGGWDQRGSAAKESSSQ
jgi:multidrug efflux system outer membrane protein